MLRSMITASNTMGQLQKQLDIVSNNIANVNTFGYKRNEATFGELLVQQFNNQPKERYEGNSRITPMGIREGVGARVSQTYLSLKQGAVVSTGRALDVAITDERTMIRVLANENGKQEIRYTRDGNLQLSTYPLDNTKVMLVTSAGNPVVDETNNPILLPAKTKGDISIGTDGTIVATPADNSAPVTANIGLSRVVRQQLLVTKGQNTFALAPNTGVGQEVAVINLAGAARASGGLRQGMIEQSNVDLSDEMTNLMTTQRAYQFNSRAITMGNDMLGLINNMRG